MDLQVSMLRGTSVAAGQELQRLVAVLNRASDGSMLVITTPSSERVFPASLLEPSLTDFMSFRNRKCDGLQAAAHWCVVCCQFLYVAARASAFASESMHLSGNACPRMFL